MANGLPSVITGQPTQVVNEGKPPKGELGAEAANVGGIEGWASFVDEAERTPELTFPASIETYNRMRTDAQIEALSLGTFQPIREFRWMIDPNNAPTNIVENAATDFGLPIKGANNEEVGVKRAANKFDFDQFVADALLGVLYGFMHDEIVGEVEEGKDWRMRKLAPRHPRTIEQFRTSDTGELLGIKQRFGQQMAMIPPEIPAGKLVSFIWRPEAGSHVGRSMLRSMYSEWMVKDRAKRIAIINLQRAGGVPVVTGPQGASNAQLEELATLARQFKPSEGGGGALPFGSKLDLVGGSVPDAVSIINYCDEAMARVWALMLVQLGVTQGANRALGGEFAIYAARAQRLMAKWIVSAVNNFLDRYTAWNEPLADYAPLLTFEPSKPEGMSVTDLVSLLDSGALTVDPELEEWLRAEFALPKKPDAPENEDLGELTPDEVALIQNARNPPAIPATDPTYKQTPLPSRTLDPTATAPTIATGQRDIPRIVGGLRASLTLPDRKLRRDPSQSEIRAAVDFRGLDATHSQTTAKLHAHYLGAVVPAQIKDLGSQIRSGTKPSALEAPVLGVEAIREQLATAATSGVNAAVREARVQGVTVSEEQATAAQEAALARAASQAEHVATLNANGLSLGAQRRAGRLLSRARSRERVASQVESHLSGQKHVFERENLKGAVTFAQNIGRITAMEAIKPEQGEPTYEASEILDERTCGPCEGNDGRVYESLEEAEADYASGGFVDCEGGPNCRGTLVATYPEQNPVGGKGDLREAEPAYVL